MLELKHRVTIRAAPEVVWPFIADPARIAEWNPKLLETDRPPGLPLRIGEQFRTVGTLRGRRMQSLTSVRVYSQPQEVAFEHLIETKHGPQRAMERYMCRPRGNGTQVIHILDLSPSGISLAWRILIWLFSVLGEEQGRPQLDYLRAAVEAVSPPAS